MRPRPPDPPGSFRAAGLHLAGLSALAVAQPLFDLLSRNAEFFAVRGSTRWDIVLFAVGLVVLPPLLLLGVEALAGLADARAATAAHLLFVGILVGVLVMQALPLAGSAVVLGAAAAAGAAAAVLYAYARPARMLLTVLAAAPLVFVGLFLLESPVSRLVLDGTPEPRLAEVPSSAPVVMVVLDELPTVSLMDAEGEI
ncbi:MAG: sulfatase-like hydrolase/transferase, partial [Gaiellaceae bacterium]